MASKIRRIREGDKDGSSAFACFGSMPASVFGWSGGCAVEAVELLRDPVGTGHIDLHGVLSHINERLEEVVQLTTVTKTHDQVVIGTGVDDDAAREWAGHSRERAALAVSVDGRVEPLRLLHIAAITAAHVHLEFGRLA